MTQFINTQNLPILVLKMRVETVAPDALIEVHSEYDDIAQQNIQVIRVTNADPNIIQAVLSAPITPIEINMVARFNNSRTIAKAIPNWATWTEQQTLDWLATNIGTPLETPIPANPISTTQIRAVLVSIVDVMKKQYTAEQSMARMIVALRDNIWSDLPD